MTITVNAATKPIWPVRWWWVGLAVILVVAGILRYTGYNFSLPYIDHVDEPAYNLAGRMIIDFGSAKPIGMQGYPPGIVMLNYVLLRFFHDPSTPPGTILWMVRLISITFSLGVIVVIGLLGYRVMNPLAGLLGAGLWTITPIIVEYSRYATADNFVTFFVLAGLFMALTSVRYDRNDWGRWGLISGLFAIIFKYQAIFVLPIILLLPLWRLTYKGHDRRHTLKYFGGTLAILIVFTLWLILLYPTIEATSSPDWSAPNERLTFPSLDNLLANFRIIYAALATDTMWLVGWLGLGVLLLKRFRQHIDWLGLGMLIMASLAWLVGLSFYGNLGPQSFRQFISAGAFLTTLRGCGLAGWIIVVSASLAYVPRIPPVIRAQSLRLGAVIVTLAVIIGALPQINASIANAREHTLHDRRNDLAVWMDTTLPSGPFISDSINSKVLNRSWGGYSGQHEFSLVEIASIGDQSIDAWRDMGVMYVITSDEAYRDMLKNPDDDEYIEQTLLLKEYPRSRAYRGPDMAVLRLFPIQYPADGLLGSVHLVGYDVDHLIARPEDAVTFTLYWKASEALDGDYTVYNHLVPMDSRDIIAQVDGVPMPDERRPTTSWNDPDETLVSRAFTIQIPVDTPVGDYRLITGFYHRDTGTRLVTPNGDDYMLVTTIRVAND